MRTFPHSILTTYCSPISHHSKAFPSWICYRGSEARINSCRHSNFRRNYSRSREKINVDSLGAVICWENHGSWLSHWCCRFWFNRRLRSRYSFLHLARINIDKWSIAISLTRIPFCFIDCLTDGRTLVDHARVEAQNHRFTYDEVNGDNQIVVDSFRP